jgi:hypothetical protein
MTIDEVCDAKQNKEREKETTDFMHLRSHPKSYDQSCAWTVFVAPGAITAETSSFQKNKMSCRLLSIAAALFAL